MSNQVSSYRLWYCPIDLKEAVAGLIFASLRCADIPELADIRKHFTLKYGKDFVKASTEVRTDSGVNPLIVGKLSSVAPDIKTKIKVLTSIAKEHNVKWDPTSFEERPKQQQPEVYLMGKQMEMESSGVKPSLSVDVEPKNHRESGSKIEEQDTSIQKDLILKLYKEAGLVPGRGTSVEENLHEMQEPSARNTSERVQQKLMSPESKNNVGIDTVKNGDGVEATNRVKPEKRKQEKGSDGGSARNRYSKFITVSSVVDDFSAEQYAMELELRAEKLRMGTPFSDANEVSVEMLQKPASDQQQQWNESHNFSDERHRSSSRLEAKKKSVVDDMNEVDCLRSEITVKESSENLNHGKSPINEDDIDGRFGVVLEDNGNGGFGTNEASASNWKNDDSILDVFYNDRNLFSPKSSSNQYAVDQSPRRETSIDGFVSQSSDFHINEEGPDKHTNSRLTDEVIDQSMLDLDVNKSDGIVFPTIWTSRDDDLHSRSSSSEISSTEDDLVRMNIGNDFVAFQSDNLFTNKAHQESLNLNFSNEEVIQDVWSLKRDVVSDDLGSERITPNTYFDVNIFGITDEMKDDFPEASATGKFDLQDDLQSEKLLMDHSLGESSTTDIVIEEKQENLDISDENEDIFPDMSAIVDDEMNNSSGVTVKYDDREGDDIKEATFSTVFVVSPERKLVDHDSSGDKNMDLSSQNTDEDTASSMFNLAGKDSFDHEITEKDVKLSSSELEVASHGYESYTHEIVTWESDIFKHGDDLNEGIKIDGCEITQIVVEEEEEVTFKDSSHVVFDDYDSDHNDHIDIFNIVNDISVESAFLQKESESSVFDLNLEDQHRNELFVNDASGLEINSTECSYSSLSEHTKEVKSVSNNTSSGIYEGSCDSYSDYVDEINSISISIESVVSDDNTAFVEEPCDPTDEAVDEKPCKKSGKEENTRKNIPCFNSDSNQDEAPKLSPPVIPKKKLIWRSRNEPADVEVSPSSKPTNQNNRLNLNDQTEYSLSNSSPSTPKTPASYESLADKLRRKWASEKVQREMESVKKSPKSKPLRPLSMDLSLLMSESSSEEHTKSEDNAGSMKSLGLDSHWSTKKQDSNYLVSRLSSQQPSSRKILREKESVNKSTKPKPQIGNIVNTRTFKSSSVDSNLSKSEPLPKERIKSEDDLGSLRSLGLDSYESRVKQDSKFMVSRLLSPRPSKKATVDEDLIQEKPNLRSLTSYQSVNKKSNSKNFSTEDTTFKDQPPQVPLENKLAKTATLDHEGSPKSLKLASNASIGTLSSEGSLKFPSPEMSSPASRFVERTEGSKPSVSVSNDSINRERDSKTVPPEQSVERSSLIAQKANIADKEITTERNSEQPTSTSTLSSPKTPSDGQIKKGYNVVAYFQSLRSNYRRA